MKGGGDAVSAARAVLQTGEYDYAWNMQVEDEILQRLEKGGKGTRRHHARRRHRAHPAQHHRPLDRGRRRARRAQDQAPDPVRSGGAPGARPAGRPQVGAGAHLRPHRHRHRATSSTTRRASARKNTKWEFNVDKANQILEAAGWKKGADGIRAKDGKKLKFVYQTSINAPRQKNQAIVKQACQKAGIDIELKSVTASVFFSSDVANPDTYPQVLLRHPDVHDDHDAARSRAVHEPVHLLGGRRPRRTSGRAATSRAGSNEEYDKAFQRRRGRARSGQARGAVHHA